MYHRPALVTKEFSYLHVALYKHCVRTFEDKQRNGTHCKDDLMASGICWLCCLGANYHTLYIDSKHPTTQVLKMIISSQPLNLILFYIKESSSTNHSSYYGLPSSNRSTSFPCTISLGEGFFCLGTSSMFLPSSP